MRACAFWMRCEITQIRVGDGDPRPSDALKTRQGTHERRTFGRYLDGGLRRLVGLLPCRCGLAAARVCATNFPPLRTRWPLPSHSLHSIPAISPVPRQRSHAMGTFSFIGGLAEWRRLASSGSKQ